MGKGDKKSRRGKITNGSYGVRRPRRKSSGNVMVAAKSSPKPKAEKAKSEIKEAKKTSGSHADKETVNFSEDHELNYHLKKHHLSQSKDNRAKLTELGDALKDSEGKKVLTHEEVDALIEKNIGDFKALGK